MYVVVDKLTSMFQEALEREKKRIEEGKKMTNIKQEMADKEIIRMAEERRREKLETLQAKDKINLQIQVRLKTLKRQDDHVFGLL